ncbi:MAG: hypothetical protein JWM11_434 [Planctomycetaceae bacterium]|nr:hypothetical protein [Planctomycetaceae bacterium]
MVFCVYWTKVLYGRTGHNEQVYSPHGIEDGQECPSYLESLLRASERLAYRVSRDCVCKVEISKSPLTNRTSRRKRFTFPYHGLSSDCQARSASNFFRCSQF